MVKNPHMIIWFSAALIFWLANVLLHLEFSNWIIAAYQTPFGKFVPRDHTRIIAFIIWFLVCIFILIECFKRKNRLSTIVAWLIAFTAMLLSMTYITTTNVEMIHFLQYAILAYLLSLAFDRDRSIWPLLTLMFMTTGLGIIDELNQYFFLTVNNSNYIDFNDFVLNQIGACGGLLARYGFRNSPVEKPPLQKFQFITAAAYCCVLIITLALFLLGHLSYDTDTVIPPGGIDLIDDTWVIFFQREPNLFSHWMPTFTTGKYYVMGFLEGFLAILFISVLLNFFKYSSKQS